MTELKLPVTDIREYIHDGKVGFKIIRLSLENQNFEFKAGEFVMLSMEGYYNWKNKDQLHWTAMSISSSSLDKVHLEFCIEIKETRGFSKYLHENLKVGDHLLVKGPMGKFAIKDMDHDMVFVGTGSGLGPIIGMIRTLVKSEFKKNFKLFFGFRYKEYFLYKEELEEYAKLPTFELFCVCSRDESWEGNKGHVQDYIRNQEFTDPENMHAYLCGNPKMVMDVKKLLETEKGFKKENMYQEQWV